ncbi:hypothetical protein [Paenibacillus wynnii]|nr:hypothetical protein [Paenibacillus wynnii]MDQ0195165.1 hypothetical protein [Paenibacillus wynnii]
MDEEPYYFEQHPYLKTTVLAEYPHDGEMRQAACGQQQFCRLWTK